MMTTNAALAEAALSYVRFTKIKKTKVNENKKDSFFLIFIYLITVQQGFRACEFILKGKS
jgi:hypothetical protein